MKKWSGPVLLALGVALAPQGLAAQESDGLYRKAAEWIGYLQAERFDSAAVHVSPIAQGSMGEGQLAMIWPEILEQFGKLEKTAPLNLSERGGYVVVQLLGTFAKGQQTIRIALDKDSMVAGFRVLTPPEGGLAPDGGLGPVPAGPRSDRDRLR